MSTSQSQSTTLLPLQRRLSIEETYNLAETARRKSSSLATRNDLRMKLGHHHMLEALEQVIRTSPPPSPKQSSVKPVRSSVPTISAVSAVPTTPSVPRFSGVDEYGFAYEDGEEDPDFGSQEFGLELTRTESRRN